MSATGTSAYGRWLNRSRAARRMRARRSSGTIRRTLFALVGAIRVARPGSL